MSDKDKIIFSTVSYLYRFTFRDYKVVSFLFSFMGLCHINWCFKVSYIIINLVIRGKLNNFNKNGHRICSCFLSCKNIRRKINESI